MLPDFHPLKAIADLTLFLPYLMGCNFLVPIEVVYQKVLDFSHVSQTPQEFLNFKYFGVISNCLKGYKSQVSTPGETHPLLCPYSLFHSRFLSVRYFRMYFVFL